MSRRADIVIVGAGIAGASLAAEIAGAASVIMLEAEDRPGFHSTGRSAAFWAESYGGPAVQPLTSASGPWLRERGFLRPRGALHLADDAGRAALDAMMEQFGEALHLERVARPALEALLPGLRPGWDEAVLEPSCADIDVAGVHAFYLGSARKSGAALIADTRFLSAERRDGAWIIETSGGTLEADILVNAAGAWADEAARRAGVPELSIQPYRRTVAQLRVDPPASADLPLVIDAGGRFYFKPEAGGRIWLSPHDETACLAQDCAAEEYDIALAIDRLQKAVDWRVERVERAWAGLRSFAPDRAPVYGFHAGRRDYFWCVGQGGFGIQTAPAAAQLAAALLLERAPEPLAERIDPDPYRPERFTN